MTKDEMKSALRVVVKDEDQQVDWVAARDECTTEAVYRAVVAMMKQDVNRMNETSTAKVIDCTFDVEENNSVETTISRTPKFSTNSDAKIGGSNIHLELKGESIVVKKPHGNKFTVNHRWDIESVRCILEVNREEIQLWQISQMALFELFFCDGQVI